MGSVYKPKNCIVAFLFSIDKMIVYRKINEVEFGVDPSKGAGLLCTPEVAKEIDGDIYEFVEYIYNTTGEYTPMAATWEITNICNFNCPFCYINTPAKPESINQFFSKMKDYIDELVESGLLLVYLTGGEILSVPDFIEIYRYLKAKGVFVVLLSNLSLLTEEHIDLFKKLPPLRITASIYGLTKKQFTYVTGAGDDVCQRVLENIILLKNMGINITCQMPVNVYTISELTSIAEWCYTNNIRFTCSNEMTDSYYYESRSMICVDDETFEQTRRQIRQVKAVESSKIKKVERAFGYKHHFDCKAGKHTFAVSYNSHIRPCFNIWENDGKAFDGSQSMSKAMHEMKTYINEMRRAIIDGCHGCEASKICSECLYTHLKHRSNIYEYMHSKCMENLARLNDL